MSNWTIQDTETGETWEKDSRKEAENAIEMFGDERDLELLEPGESPDSETASDGGTDVVRGGGGVDPADGSLIEPGEEDSDTHPQGPPSRTTGEMETSGATQDDVSEAVELQGDGSVPLEDPLSMLPGWMITEVSYNDRGDNSTTVNKRGCQVIARSLDIEVKTTAVTRASESDFEYAEFEAVAERPNGQTFTGNGTARADKADQGEDAGWKLDMMAETRAYKRAVKNATGGGIEAFAKEGGN